MIITRNIGFSKMLKWTAPIFLSLFLFVGAIVALYHYKIITISLPWLPISVIGTAVAFFVGFKSNQAYDRMWEARKIWGGIVNDSRTWGMLADTLINNDFATNKIADEELKSVKKRLIYRHIAWLYAHRNLLLIPTSWEHITQGGATAKTADYFRKRFGLGLIEDELTRTELQLYLHNEEYEAIIKTSNPATQLLNTQAKDLEKIRQQGLIEEHRHMRMVSVLQNFFDHQGKNERIKKFPLPRQYANMSRYFVGLFILLFPFSMVPELMKAGEWGIWLSLPITMVIAWVYITMELVGDHTENPFQGMANDIPMLSLCRTIEIDLRELLKDNDIPKPIQPVDGILM